MNLARLLSIVTLVAAFAAPLAAEPRHAKLDEALRRTVERGCTGKKSVIVRTKPGYREGLRQSLAAHGDVVKGEFPALDAIAAEVHCDDLVELAGFGSTASVSENVPLHAQQLGGVSDALSGTTSSLLARLNEALSALSLQSNLFSTLSVRQSLQSLTSGSGIGVAVIDSGIQPGMDFGSRISAFYDFTHGDIRAVSASDLFGHGTHVAGLIGGTYIGIAPATRLIGLKVLDAQGQGTTDNVIRAIEFAIVNKDVLKIHVLNLSLGHPIYESAATDPLVQAVEHAVRAGLTVVVSAGNYGINRETGQVGYAGIASPGNAPSAITVGSVRTFNTVARNDDRIAAYSSRGPSWYDGFAKPDVAAPGDNLLSIAPLNSVLRLLQEQRGNTGNYMRLSGTSMAAGVVSGVWRRCSSSQSWPDAERGQDGAAGTHRFRCKVDGGSDADALTQGTGSINPAGALTLAKAINPAAATGAKLADRSVTPSTKIGAETYAWAQQIIWGNHIARGGHHHRAAARLGARRSSGATCSTTTTTSSGAISSTTTTSCGATVGRQHCLGQQHRLGQQLWTTTTSCGATSTTTISSGATTSSGATRLIGFDGRRQHRVGQLRRRQHRLGQPRRRQHRVGQSHDDDNIVWGNSASGSISEARKASTRTQERAADGNGDAAFAGRCADGRPRRERAVAYRDDRLRLDEDGAGSSEGRVSRCAS